MLVLSINCHKPVAPTLDIAVGFRADSITGKYFNSIGILYLSNACSKIGKKYFPLGNPEEVEEHITDYDVIVNATPLGTKEADPMPLGHELLLKLKKTAVIYDLVYARETKLITEAKKRGLRVANGLGMLVNQGALSFKIWNPDVDLEKVKKVMRKAAEKELEKRK